MTKPQVIIIFSVLAIVGFFALIFIGVLPGLQKKPGISAKPIKGELSLWSVGDNAAAYGTAIAIFNSSYPEVSVKTRIFDSAEEYETELLDSLAAGRGPDVFVIPNTDLVRYKDKIAPAPVRRFGSFQAQALFPDIVEKNFIDGGLVYALPVSIDTLALFYNQDIFNQAAVVFPPKKWSEFYDIVPRIVSRDRSGDIVRAAVSFGEYKNITHAKEIVSLLMMQAGATIVVKQGAMFTPTLTQGLNLSVGEASAAALQFFTQFSKTDRDSYSWNRSLPASRSMFEAGDLATYFGYASEHPGIKLRNPHLNFDLTSVPQTDNSTKRMTFGRVQGAAIVRASGNQEGALRAAILLGTAQFGGELASRMSIPPVRRDLLAVRPTDAVSTVLYDAALVARSWTDPAPSETDQIFGNMVDDIVSGRFKVSQAIGTAQSALQKIISKYHQ
jgi:ABC-type glycerol-3-phosphate transport system substrate-binding protein